MWSLYFADWRCWNWEPFPYFHGVWSHVKSLPSSPFCFKIESRGWVVQICFLIIFWRLSGVTLGYYFKWYGISVFLMFYSRTATFWGRWKCFLLECISCAHVPSLKHYARFVNMTFLEPVGPKEWKHFWSRIKSSLVNLKHYVTLLPKNWFSFC